MLSYLKLYRINSLLTVIQSRLRHGPLGSCLGIYFSWKLAGMKVLRHQHLYIEAELNKDFNVVESFYVLFYPFRINPQFDCKCCCNVLLSQPSTCSRWICQISFS